MSMIIIDEIVDYANKRVDYANKRVDTLYDDADSFSDQDDQDDFYNHYEPFTNEEFNDGDDYESFDPEAEEREYELSRIKQDRVLKPYAWMTSPTKTPKASPTKPPTWWEKTQTIEENARIINGVLNYGALLPPPSIKKTNKKKNKKNPNSTRAHPQQARVHPQQARAHPQQARVHPQQARVHPQQARAHPQQARAHPQQARADQCALQKPTRFCMSFVKNMKCFHGSNCKFAHQYSDLKECNFGDECKKVEVVKTTASGVVLKNRAENICIFKHANETKASYLARVPQQTPRK
jgi:chemotaxis protein histidine kinase CheA